MNIPGKCKCNLHVSARHTTCSESLPLTAFLSQRVWRGFDAGLGSFPCTVLDNGVLSCFPWLSARAVPVPSGRQLEVRSRGARCHPQRFPGGTRPLPRVCGGGEGWRDAPGLAFPLVTWGLTCHWFVCAMATRVRILQVLYFSCLSTAFLFCVLPKGHRFASAERCVLCNLWCIILTIPWYLVC